MEVPVEPHCVCDTHLVCTFSLALAIICNEFAKYCGGGWAYVHHTMLYVR